MAWTILDDRLISSEMASPERLLRSVHRPSLPARYQALIRLANAIRGYCGAKNLFDVLAAELSEVLSLDAIAQFDERSDKLYWWCRADDASNRDALEQIPRDETIAWWVHENQEPVVISSPEKEARFPATMACFLECGIRSVGAVPLTTSHRRLGSLIVASEAPDAYSAEDMLFLSLVANQIALATDDALNAEASQRAQERLSLILDLSNRITAKLELSAMMQEISVSIRGVMQCDAVAVLLSGVADNSFHLYSLDFPRGRGMVDDRRIFPMEETPNLWQVMQSGKPLTLRANDPAFDQAARDEGLQSACYLPLHGKTRPLGVLGLGRLDEIAFTEDDVEFLSQVAYQIALAVENALAYGEVEQTKNRLAEEKLYLEDEIRSELNFEEIIGKSSALRQVLKQVETVAPTDSTVLIYGETGTGKELIARALHNLSSRRAKAFVKLNCAAIPTGLLESELFGHEKGAFTGAITQRIGRFELAHQGTVFLDEVGEIPLELQPKLLRVLQEREFERLGSVHTLRTDARLIAATNRDLAAMVEQQIFRQDLFYRLNVFPIRVPPLRERPEDIPLLVRHFVQQFSLRTKKHIDSVPSETMTALVCYPWPGNVRELQNVIERAVILSPGPSLHVSLDELRTDSKPRPTAVSGKTAMRDVLEEMERDQILRALEDAKGIVSGPDGAAARLGMKRSTLQFRMQKLGIKVSRTSSA